MKLIASFLLGFICFYFAVLQPLRANAVASVAMQNDINAMSRASILEFASTLDPCNTDILDRLGDAWIATEKYHAAAIAYGRIIQCSPGNSIARFKYGESIIGMGFLEGKFSVDDALKLEPSSPLYQREAQRLKELQPQSQ